jgi:hypothetical protein
MYKMALRLIHTILVSIIFSYYNVYATTSDFPIKAEVIGRNQADYLTPENAFLAIHSCTLAANLEWCDETMTTDSLREYIQKFHDAGIDRNAIFNLAKNVKESFIVGKVSYMDSIILLIEDHGSSGSINVMPLTFVEDNGKWKMTNKYSADEEVNQYLYYVPPLFDGKGQKPDDVNSFLGYEQPTQAQTELPANTAQYRVHLYYAKTVDPATFTAELNKQDITTQFSPKPFTDEEVEIPLPRGRNTLVLSIEGTRKDGKKARDTDRLIFIVP